MKTQTRFATTAVLSQQAADEYSDSILEHLIEVDRDSRPDAAMINQQPEINWKMWPFLVDGLVELHYKLKMKPQTLFLAVNILNRYCTRRIVYQKHFHLVGCTALWIASKYEDKKSVVPTLAMLKHMTNDYYPEKMFVMMENHILNTLEWSISHCGVDSFLQVFLSQSPAPPLLHSLSSYIAEITLYHNVFVGRDPLLIAKAIQILSLHLLNMESEDVKCDYIDAEGMEEIYQQWVPTLGDLILTPPRAVLEKCRSSDRVSVTRVVDEWVLRRQRQVQEEAIAKATAAAKAKSSMMNASSISLPITPPSSARESSKKPMLNMNSNTSGANLGPHNTHAINSSSDSHYSSVSDLTPPNSAQGNNRNFRDDTSGSPLTIHSLASLTSLSSVTSLCSVNSIDAAACSLGALDSLSQSPPVTPLNPPKHRFRV